MVAQSRVRAGSTQCPTLLRVGPCGIQPSIPARGDKVTWAAAQLGSGCRCARRDLRGSVWALPRDSNAAQHPLCGWD